jgi:hypothetical protein
MEGIAFLRSLNQEQNNDRAVSIWYYRKLGNANLVKFLQIRLLIGRGGSYGTSSRCRAEIKDILNN